MPANDYQTLINFLNSNPSAIEVEARIGEFKQYGFRPGVSSYIFEHVKNSLLRMSVQKGGSLEVSKTNTKVYHAGLYMKIEDLDTTTPSFYRKKSDKGNIDIVDWGYRIAKAYEENIPKKQVKDIDFPSDVYRMKRRISFIDRNEEGLLYGVQLDLTIVTHHNKGKEFQTFEIEMERKIPMTADTFMDKFEVLYYIYQQLDKIYLQGFYMDPVVNKDMAKELIKDTFKQSMRVNEKKEAITTFNRLFSTNPKDDRLILYRNEPKNIKVENLFKPHDYAITSKLDGVRKFLFVTKDAAYFINPPYEIVRLSSPKGAFDITFLIDGEFISESFRFNGFDILYFRGKNITQNYLKERLQAMQKAFESLVIKKDISMLFPISQHTKTFYDDKDFYKNVSDALKNNERLEKQNIKTDGLIIQPINKPYINDSTYKWKPVDQLTIDFNVVSTSLD